MFSLLIFTLTESAMILCFSVHYHVSLISRDKWCFTEYLRDTNVDDKWRPPVHLSYALSVLTCPGLTRTALTESWIQPFTLFVTFVLFSFVPLVVSSCKVWLINYFGVFILPESSEMLKCPAVCWRSCVCTERVVIWDFLSVGLRGATPIIIGVFLVFLFLLIFLELFLVAVSSIASIIFSALSLFTPLTEAVNTSQMLICGIKWNNSKKHTLPWRACCWSC